jgi:hypothetical protein
MALVPDATQKGLWVNSHLKSGEAGVFALVVGVSRYDHLADGAQPAAETYGLGQLGVSALTAYRFFHWLRDGYALKGWPVAKARLLLSPLKIGIGAATKDELDGCDAEICNNAIEANFCNCKSAIENWYADMEAIAPGAEGRSLFFFTGHGLEIRRLHQVLLPSDYCRPPGKAFNDSISTRNLIDNLPLLPRVSSHVLLLDACRNDLEKFRGKGVEGAKILNDDVAEATNTASLTGVLHSTQSGHQAYQPKSGGISLFGQALLDGLKTVPDPTLDESPIELHCRDGICRVEINSLTSYVKGRIAALVKAAGEQVVQEVRVDVSSPDPNNRQIDLNEIDDSQPQTSTSGHTFAHPTRTRGGVAIHQFWPEGPQRHHVGVEERAAWLDRRYSDREILVPPQLPPGATDREKADRLHYLFQSEAITYPWLESLRVSALATGEESEQSAVDIISIRWGDRTPALHRVQVQLRITCQDKIGHLLTIQDVRGQRFGCILPSDTSLGPPQDRRDPIYQLEIDVGETDAGIDSFIRFAASLSPQNREPLGTAARIWERLRALDPAAATDLITQTVATAEIESASINIADMHARYTDQPEAFFRESERALAGKVESPLGAAVAGLVLLKANRFDLMHDWARNVGNWFPWLPDGVVLWTEQRRRMARDKPLDPALLSWFVTNLSSRSLPFTSDCFGLAADILRDILRGRIKADEATLHGARLLNTRFDSVMDSFRDDALFCTYAGWENASLLRTLVAPPSVQRSDLEDDVIFNVRPVPEPEVVREKVVDGAKETDTVDQEREAPTAEAT